MRCQRGSLLHAPPHARPRFDEPFVIVDERLGVQSISHRAEALLMVDEPPRSVARLEELLIPANGDAEGVELARLVESAIAGAPAPASVELRGVGEPAIRFAGRVVSCGPPRAALLVLSPRTVGTRRGGDLGRRRGADWNRHEDFDAYKLDLLTASFARSINSEVALLCQLDGKRRPPIVASSWGLGPTIELAMRPPEGGFVDRALGAKRAVVGPLYPLLDRDLIQASGRPLRHAVVAPVRTETGVRGALLGGFVTEPRNRSRTLFTAESYAALFAFQLDSPRTLEGLFGPAGVDGVTGCLTNDGTRRALARELNRSGRGRLPLSCCFITLDGFTRTNRRRGRTRGNELRRRVGRILRDGIRSCDTVGRGDGEAFVAILPETSEAGARHVADRLRALTETAKPNAGEPAIAASVAVATWTPGESAEQLLSRGVQSDHQLAVAPPFAAPR